LKLSEILSFDHSLKAEQKNEDLELVGINPSGFFLPQRCSFISNRDHLKSFLEKYPKDEKLAALIITAKIWTSLSNEHILVLKNAFDHIYSAPCAIFSLTKFSKFFYLRETASDNELVDGRIMGNCSIHPTAEISQNVFIGSNVQIHAGVKIQAGSIVSSYSEIGENSIIYPNVTLYRKVKLGANCRIHSGAVLGADGFGYHFYEGQHHKIWHYGGVEIGSDVEIGANSCVDCGTFVPTKIGRGSKIDNHVQIGHNVELDVGVIICGHVAIGGSSKIGAFTVFGGKSGMGDNMTLGKACQVAGGALVNTDWPDQTVLGGHPARPLKEWMRGLAYLRKHSLPKDQNT
jgi:UDP-3-O-[3-hydroxymyristoyl] glucosamine N-acyltransferase